MKRHWVTAALGASFACVIAGQQRTKQGGFTQPDPIDFNEHAGWQSMFDGVSLKGWDGSPRVWRAENGAILGESTPEQPVGTTYLIWEGGEPANFELKAEVKLEGAGANSGIQYRSARTTQPQGGPRPNPEFAKWNLKGYQADIDFANRYTGQLYEQGTGRGIIAWRGQMVRTEAGKRPRLLSVLGDPDTLKEFVKTGDWNQMHIIARGNTMIHSVNGHVMSVFIDDDSTKAPVKGVIGLQIEGQGRVKVSYRNLWIRSL